MCQHDQHDGIRPHCCPTVRAVGGSLAGVTRRGFLGGTALGAAALSGLSWSALAATGPDIAPAPPRRPLVVKPVFLYQLYQRRPQTSWRSWGGIHSQQDADQEVARIQGELEKLQKMADFPLQFQPVTATSKAADLAAMDDVKSADALLVYACDGDLNQIAALGKDTIFFLRHQSGPLYLYYEIISPRFLRQHGDALAVKGIDDQDVVVDSLDEVLWRLRSLCGLRNTMGTKILAVGGPGAWAHPAEPTAKLVSEKFKFDIQTVTYDELGKLIQAARQDQAAVALAKKRAADYLQMPETKLETEGQFVENCMLLDQVFRKLMQEAGCRALTINACMGTIMP
ncbi:MAG: twin-arginine translocation signal domain-containing protein, partial [Thermoguttaceae bacterium]|nr:twin-arginine translocation signal domain-containing protein [Thermoguttaceae bacterium]